MKSFAAFLNIETTSSDPFVIQIAKAKNEKEFSGKKKNEHVSHTIEKYIQTHIIRDGKEEKIFEKRVLKEKTISM